MTKNDKTQNPKPKTRTPKPKKRKKKENREIKEIPIFGTKIFHFKKKLEIFL